MQHLNTNWVFALPLLFGVGHMSIVAAEESGRFIAAGEMITPRSGHTATLLADGRVLIAGGVGESGTPLSSIELYDPSTGVFTAAGEMNTARYAHTATLLAEGKILIAGGYGLGYTLLASAELYDPASGTFTATGAMVTPQIGHTATPLGNGKVLIAGGLQGPPWPTAVAAELYDPSTGTFGSGGNYTGVSTMYPPAVGPIWPTATPLSDGRILIVGNNPAELYEPEAEKFTITGSMVAPAYRFGTYWHTATLLPNGKVLISGGTDEFSIFDDAEVYDPDAGTFANTGGMSARRALHTATLLADGTVLITGGETWLVTGASGRFGGSLASTELYSPSEGIFAPAGSMALGRASHTATLLKNGNVLITGGVDYPPFPSSRPFKSSASAELYVPDLNGPR
jgi:hypothetical protein